jgi:serine/threonine-protein kinase RIO1
MVRGSSTVPSYSDYCLIWTGARLVHGDLSEYNILVYKKSPWMIDVAQAVETMHPNAVELLMRDCENLSLPFRRVGIETLPHETLAEWVMATPPTAATAPVTEEPAVVTEPEVTEPEVPSPENDKGEEEEEEEEDAEEGGAIADLGAWGPLLEDAWMELIASAREAMAKDTPVTIHPQEEDDDEEEEVVASPQAPGG